MKSASFKNYVKFDPEDLSEPARDAPEIEKQFSEICEELQKTSDLECLDLSGNTLSEIQFKKLAKVLESHKKLVILDLEYNRIGLATIPYLKKIIKDHPWLTDISMDYNEIDDAALTALLTDDDADYLESLKKIDFRFYRNKITEQGLGFALDRISPDSCSTIISFNKVKESEQERFRQTIKARKALIEANQASASQHSTISSSLSSDHPALASATTGGVTKSALILSSSPGNVQTKKDSYEQEEKKPTPEHKSPLKK